MQKQENKSTSGIQDTNLSEILGQAIATPASRDVTLVYTSCCGCGCYDIQIRRTVPYDSDLHDGDTVYSLEPEDVKLD